VDLELNATPYPHAVSFLCRQGDSASDLAPPDWIVVPAVLPLYL